MNIQSGGANIRDFNDSHYSDRKLWRIKSAKRRDPSFIGLAVVAVAGRLAGYALLAGPSVDSQASPAFVSAQQ
jgi:hypothetical protein